MALVLGAALGAHTTVAEVRDADTGALRGTGRVPHAAIGPDDAATWWRSLVAAIAEAGERHIAAVAVTGDHPGLVLLDEAGLVLRTARSWDGARAEVARVRKALGAERWARRAGFVPGPTTAVTRLAWLRRTDGRSFQRIGTALLPHEWLTYRLAGRAMTDRGSASGTGLWSPHTGRWIPDVLELLAPEGRRDAWVRHLPEVLDAGARGDWLDAPVFEQLHLRGRPLVAPGTGAPMAVALALGLEPGSIGISLGDGTTVVAPLDAPLVDATGSVASRADATGGHLAVAATPGGATLVAALAELLGTGVADVGRAAMEATDPVGDLLVIPGLDGRSGAVVTGLGAGATRAALARATFDGIACAALAAVDALAAAGVRRSRQEPLHLTGPADGLETHARTLADLAGHPVVATAGDAAAAGACVQAASVLTGVPAGEVAVRWQLAGGRRIEPDGDGDGDRERRRALHAAEAARQLRAWSP